MPPSKEPQRFDPLAPCPKHYALLSKLPLLHQLYSCKFTNCNAVASHQKQAEDQRKEVEKLDKKFEALSEESKETKKGVKGLQDRIAEAKSASG